VACGEHCDRRRHRIKEKGERRKEKGERRKEKGEECKMEVSKWRGIGVPIIALR